jgi:hypothetical protein
MKSGGTNNCDVGGYQLPDIISSRRKAVTKIGIVEWALSLEAGQPGSGYRGPK